MSASTEHHDTSIEGDLGTIDRSEIEPESISKPESVSEEKSESAKPESDTTTTPTTSSVNEEQQKEINEAAEKLEEQVAQAYTKTSSWMGGLWSSISKQSSVILEEVGKDFEAVKYEVGEFAKRKEGTNEKVDESAREKGDDSAKDESANDTVDSSRDLLSLLSTKAQLYIDNLDKDLEKVEDAGAAYFSKIGSNFQALMRETIRVEGGDSTDTGSTDTLLFNAPEEVRQQVFSTRFDAQLHSLHTSEEVFLQPVDTGYESFKSGFDINSQTDQIARDLEAHPALRTLMEKLVPESIDYNSFWTRYYYMYNGIVAGEEQRKKVLSQAAGGGAAGAADAKEFDWDESDEETKTETTESYDVVSRVASDVTLDKAEKGDKGEKGEKGDAKPAKPAKSDTKPAAKPAATEEESDDDWE